MAAVSISIFRFNTFNGYTRRIRSTVRTSALPITSSWKQVIDSSSGKPYYWNTKTNETRWDIPESKEEQPVNLSYEELTDILLAADADKFGDIANNYRPQCFEVSYFDYLTARIESEGQESKLALERLRARRILPHIGLYSRQ